MRWKIFPLKLVWHAQVTPTVRHLAFVRDDGEPFEFTAGQFINIHFEVEGELVHRSYSVANPPDQNPLIEIAVAPVEGGHATKLLFGLERGAVVQASGPYGRFVLRDDPPARYILIGTGTGITPYRAMLPELAIRLESGEFSAEMLLGVRNSKELLYGQEFMRFAEIHSAFRFRACLSREEPAASEPHLSHGYVQQQFDGLELKPETDIVYLCGNPNMIDDAVDQLKASGFPIKSLRREKYLAAKH